MRKITTQPRETKAGRWPWIVLAAAVLFSAYVRIRLLQIPLERDEGEFAYVGQLLLYGVPPYKMAYNMKLPGIYAAYALIIALFKPLLGKSPGTIHLGFLLVNLGCIALVFALTRRLFGTAAAATASAAYAILSLSPCVNGTSAHATHFVVLCALAGMVLAFRAAESARGATFYLSGLMFGLSFLMKQPGGAFALLGLGYLVWAQVKLRSGWRCGALRLMLFALGGISPVALTVVWLWKTGALSSFMFWTVTYCREYATQVALHEVPKRFWNATVAALDDTWPIYLLAGLGLAALAADPSLRKRLPYVLGLFFCSLAALFGGFYFRSHYYVVVLPAVAVTAGAGVAWAQGALRGRLKLLWIPAGLLLAFGAARPIAVNGGFFFAMPVEDASRFMYGANPFNETVRIADYIEARTDERDTIAVMGSEPQIYYYTGRLAATAYIYMYALMELQPYAARMQFDCARQIEAARPKYIVFVRVATSWLGKKKSETAILRWFASYSQNYTMVGIADIQRGWTEYRWGPEADRYRPLSNCYVEVYERIPG